MKTKTLKTVDVASLVVDLVIPVWEDCKVLRSVDGGFYMWEVNRWGSEDLCRSISRRYADRLLEQAYPGPAAGYAPSDRKAAAGCIGG